MEMPNKRILLVDDNESVREFEKKALEREGYQVVEATDGQEALELFQSASRNFALVLTDYKMPRLNGKGLAVKIQEIDSRVPIVLITGQESINTKHVRAWRIQALLHKPFAVEEFLALVRRFTKPDDLK